MRKVIFMRCVLITLVALLLSSVISSAILQFRKEQDTTNNMGGILHILIQTIANEDNNDDVLAKQMSEICGGYRITILGLDGTPLGDSHYDHKTMPNHKDRVEIQGALHLVQSKSKRTSSTMQDSMLYVAIKSEEKIYRISTPVEGFFDSMKDTLPALILGLIVALIVTPILSQKIATDITKPLLGIVDNLREIEDGEYGKEIELPNYDEIRPIITMINMLSRNISMTLAQLTYQKEKTKYLLNSMDSGLVLLDDAMRILQVNTAARTFFDGSKHVVGKNLVTLTYHPAIIKGVEDAIHQGKTTTFDLDFTVQKGLIFSVYIAPIIEEWMEIDSANGVLILMNDVTATRSMEQMRSEFIANVSHELKTPITSIRGFAELLSNGVITDQNRIQTYLGIIKDESERMTNVVDDILNLSNLETAVDIRQDIGVDLLKLANEICVSLTPQIKEKNLTVSIVGSACIVSNQQYMHQLLRNLIDNAVKYNVQDGSVFIELHKMNGKCKIIVSDTGIGIPQEQQPRVFERFYRVDKGRSRKVGGTGLGLSIIKHIVVNLNGDIQLFSSENIGTKIVVTIPYRD